MFPSRPSLRRHLWTEHRKDLIQVQGCDRYVDLSPAEYERKSRQANLRWMSSAERQAFYKQYGAWKDAKRAGIVPSAGCGSQDLPPPCIARRSGPLPVDLFSSDSEDTVVSCESDGREIDTVLEEWERDPPGWTVGFPDETITRSPVSPTSVEPLPVDVCSVPEHQPSCSDDTLLASLTLPDSAAPDQLIADVRPLTPPSPFADSPSPLVHAFVAIGEDVSDRVVDPDLSVQLAGTEGREPDAFSPRSSSPESVEYFDVTAAAEDDIVPIAAAAVRAMGLAASVDEIVLAVSRCSPSVDLLVIRRLVRSALLAERNLASSLQNVLMAAALSDRSGQFGLLNIQAVLETIMARRFE